VSHSQKCKALRLGIRQFYKLASLHYSAKYDIIVRKTTIVKDEEGNDQIVPSKIQVVLEKMCPRALYQRAKKAVYES